ncbi:DUF3048 domain-containing protein [Nocardioides panacisoli]|uniref:DUF3048 domain-containing protein n=1 Tax=Nocardioides panacisoli TaxID=627624 RepID=UPI001C63606B|nr:DUF3048 domain-containing protein [Nocardioides panacisoli]QYJ04259.1 DUF3048 domain-containing protein [Nocardioides panacisoli]
MRRHAFVRTTVATATLAFALAACGGEEPEESSPEPAESSAPAEPETWPLTGLEADGSVAKDRPPLVVKYDNTASSAPQVGLGRADLVVEELVEGGYTRLAAFFYSKVPQEVGPVRSMRTSDIGIVSPVGAEIVTSGGAARTVGAIKNAGITFHSEGSPGFGRDSGRAAPYNLMTNLAETAKATEDGTEDTPPDYLAWGDAADLPQGKPASSIQASFGSRVTEWQFRGGKYRNTNSYAAEDDRFVADTVLALKVQIGDAGYLDPAGSFVPETKFEGQGKAVLFHDGRAIQATWSKDALDGEVTLSTSEGDLAVPPGRTWIELVPANDAAGKLRPGDITFQK